MKLGLVRLVVSYHSSVRNHKPRHNHIRLKQQFAFLMLYHRNQPSRVNLKEMLSIAFIKQLEVAASGFSVLGYPGEITCPKFCP